MKEITLTESIKIKDSRNLGCGILIESTGKNKFMNLSFIHDAGFFINLSGTRVTQDNFSDFYKELEEVRIAMVQGNRYLTQ